MKLLKQLPAHGAILIGNMYYVFWGIDRVNRSMNFIDNGYTKLLILMLILFCLMVDVPLAGHALRRLQKTKNPGPLYARLGILGLNALLCAVILLMLLIDLFNEDLFIFLNEFAKLLILMLSITGLLNALQFIARERAIQRILARRANQRQGRPANAPSRPAVPAAYSAPARRPAPGSAAGYGAQRTRPANVARSSVSANRPANVPARSQAGYGSQASRTPASRSSTSTASSRISAARTTPNRSVSVPTRSSTRIPERRS